MINLIKWFRSSREFPKITKVLRDWALKTERTPIMTRTRNHKELVIDVSVFEGFGLLEPIMQIAKSIIQTLPHNERSDFLSALKEAVGREGKDLTRVHWAFLSAEFRAIINMDEKVKSVIDPVILGMDLLANGEEWPNLDAWNAYQEASDMACSIQDDAFFETNEAAYHVGCVDPEVIHLADTNLTNYYAASAAHLAAYAATPASTRYDTEDSHVSRYISLSAGYIAEIPPRAYTALTVGHISEVPLHALPENDIRIYNRIRQRDTLLQLIRDAK